ncbi:MAG: hypothetical protein HOC74_30060 [Gemmatimonadetes bacterium]|jgi:hypothetical protein|nr:hypothetical protein [Gemmatimonadota bacterium]
MMDRENEGIFLLDMGACEPKSAVGEEFARGKWATVEYSIEQGRGRMLFSGPDSQAPPICLKLPVSGWYHIFIGTYRHPLFPDSCLLLKLASDPAYSRATTENFRPEKDLVSPEMLPGPADLCEAYWKSVALTEGEVILFHRPAAGSMADTIANITYVHLIPLSEEERKRAENERGRADTRRLIANFDGGQHHMWAYATTDEVRDEFQAVAGSDFGIALWGVGRSFATFYPSRIASEIDWAFGMPGVMRVGLQSVDRRRRHGFDPLAAAVECAHEAGVELYPQMRMSGEQWPPNHLQYGGPGEFQSQHPEFRCLTSEGYATRHLSQAFPEVRSKYVQLFREWVEEYGADGVCIVFCRSWPYALYEEPVLASFKELHGTDMRKLDFFDDRILDHRASFLTTLLRETRQMLDEVGAKLGRRLGTCYVVPATGYTPQDCPDLGPFTTPRSRAMDLETWVREGLVDHLVTHIESIGQPDGSDVGSILAPWVELAKDSATQVHADLYPRRQSADSMRIRALACYETGVDGLCFWDCQGRAQRLSGWAMHRLLGHREELDEMKEFADSLFRRTPLIELDGFQAQNEFCVPTDG